ncbi:Uma2 family endonuclease [Rivularia sp. UHCC 0363]|uniref:Uma2 family endonuclease n=1 Tax=Rivularia sp. UHCC 0363 TaxID=3110244 RepID=UPI002B2017D2|nr:Uma2 family endonuclease [Rivularia sp. UHCC 0363]MEA5594364.1 Uma2 family endonuclease [Rivularia sp. UHCC 0363]
MLEEIRLKQVKISQITATAENSNAIDFTSGAISARFCGLLSAWVESHQLGYVVNSNSGFQRFNGDIITPHISFYSKEKLKQVPRIYPEVLPDLVVEIKSAFEQLSTVQNKIIEFLEMEIGSALLINPDDRTVTVYIYERDRKQIVNVLRDGERLSLPRLFPDWELEVSQLWVT